MEGSRLGQGQLQQLCGAMIHEGLTLGGGAPQTVWGAFNIRRNNRHLDAWEQEKKKTNELFAEAAALDIETAELELDPLRPQLATLMWVALYEGDARAWTSAEAAETTVDRPEGTDPRRWVRFHHAVEALMEFYFGGPGAEHDVLAETQLAWMATRRPVLRKKSREVRRKAHRRYSELWDAWAQSTQSTARPVPAS